MSIDQKVVERLQELIELGQKVRSSVRSSDLGSYHPNDESLIQLRTSSLSLLNRVFGTDSEYYRSVNDAKRKVNDAAYDVEVITGALKAAKDDYENGHLFTVRTLIEAEVFDTLLEQAENLLISGYYQPAAVIAGAVLEDGLRKLCARYPAITLSNRPALDYMNGQLAKHGAYNSLTQKKITALADIRNSAAHGKWTEFNKDDVQKMIADVRDFMEKHFSK